MPPRKIAPQQFPPWVRVWVRVRVGDNLPGGATFQGDIFLVLFNSIIFSSISVDTQKIFVRKCSVKKVFLEIWQNSQENNCARGSFLLKLQPLGLQSLTGGSNSAHLGLGMWLTKIFSVKHKMSYIFEFI